MKLIMHGIRKLRIMRRRGQKAKGSFIGQRVNAGTVSLLYRPFFSAGNAGASGTTALVSVRLFTPRIKPSFYAGVCVGARAGVCVWVLPLKDTEGLFVNQQGGLEPRVVACMQNRRSIIAPLLYRTGGHSSHARGAEGGAGASDDEEEGG